MRGDYEVYEVPGGFEVKFFSSGIPCKHLFRSMEDAFTWISYRKLLAIQPEFSDAWSSFMTTLVMK